LNFPETKRKYDHFIFSGNTQQKKCWQTDRHFGTNGQLAINTLNEQKAKNGGTK